MRILHLASGNRWTGAAAPAFAEVEALRLAGHDSHYAYVGGYKLEAKIGHHDFAHAAIEKAQNPLAFKRTIERIDRLVEAHRFDVIHAHLTYDHWIARVVARNRHVKLARTIHARRVLRSDPLTWLLFRATDLLFVVNDEFAAHPQLRHRNAIFTPPPLDHRQFTPEGANTRALYEIAPETKLVTVIGKLSKDRGFEEALRTFALLRETTPARMMVIGHGEHRPTLEALAAQLGIAPHVIWAGYHEDDLAEHYRASDVLLFTARGSDEGHRAILEAMACGVVPAAFPIEGVRALTGDAFVSDKATSPSLAKLTASILERDLVPLRREVTQRSLTFGYEEAARRLLEGYGRV
jgi:glycosyltransferase involved in cell wall biosynthesis